jgi:tRNA(fMet)-specific endonuclease VapC
VAALVDTSVFIAAERGTLDLQRLQQSRQEFVMAAITASELLHGVHRVRGSGRKARAEAYVEALLNRIPVVPFDLACARAHGRIGAALARRGVTVGSHDLLIGATALALGLAILTLDRRGFAKIPDLEVEQA